MPYLDPAPPRALAHRGLALRAPENTLLAFADAVAAGATHIETDVRVSRDGVAVLCHDEDLRRIAGRDERVHRLTVAELGRVPLGEDQELCSLSEALAAFPDTRFNLDIKSPAAVGATVRAVLAADAVDRVLITSFSERRRRAAARQLPGVASSPGTALVTVVVLLAALGLRPLLRRALRGIVAVQVPPRRLGIRFTTRRLLRALHHAGVEVHLWTLNDREAIRAAYSLGVDGVVTDRVDVALEVLAERL